MNLKMIKISPSLIFCSLRLSYSQNNLYCSLWLPSGHSLKKNIHLLRILFGIAIYLNCSCVHTCIHIIQILTCSTCKCIFLLRSCWIVILELTVWPSLATAEICEHTPLSFSGLSNRYIEKGQPKGWLLWAFGRLYIIFNSFLDMISKLNTGCTEIRMVKIIPL